MRVTLVCPQCRKSFTVIPARVRQGVRYCSRACAGLSMRGERHPRWNPGRLTASNGYMRVRVGRGRYVAEHRAVAEAVLGRPLLPTEVVHHQNGDTTDNRPENIEVMSRARHRSLHAKGGPDRWARDYERCVICGETATRHRGHGRCSRCYDRERHQQYRRSVASG